MHLHPYTLILILNYGILVRFDSIMQILGLTWGVWDEPIFNLCPRIILGADVLYDTGGRIFYYAVIYFYLSCNLSRNVNQFVLLSL